MKLSKSPAEWVISLDAGAVGRIEVDFRLGLILKDGTGMVSVHIGTACNLTDGTTTTMVPEQPQSVCPILPLFNAGVLAVRIAETGHLKVCFADGRARVAAPDDRYEAWEIGGTGGFLFGGLPGGGVAVFLDPGVAPEVERGAAAATGVADHRLVGERM